MEKDENVRPWGRYDVLYDGDDCKVKRITVNPHSRLSLQSHEHREEMWLVVLGELTVHTGHWTGDIKEHKVKKTGSTKIKQGMLHRAENKTSGPVVFIEIQTGTYFGEDDIVRYEDDYGRV